MPLLPKFDPKRPPEKPQDVEFATLRLLRRLAELGWLEHPVAGPPSGAFCIDHEATTQTAA